MTFTITVALSAFLMSLLGTRIMILALHHRPVPMDIDSLRNKRKAPPPKGGGIVVVFALVICLLNADIGYHIVLSLLLLTAVSLLDDLVGVPVAVRLVVQAVAVAIPLSTMQVSFLGGMIPDWLEQTGIFLLWMWFINLFNRMDGIDGLSTVEMISIGIGLCLPVAFTSAFPDHLALHGLIVAAAASGFLWWNWQPAKILLGSVGAVPIGFLLGYLLFIAAARGYGAAAIILPAYYLSDAGITLLARLVKGKKNSDYYYRKAIRAGRSHDAVARYIFGVNFLLILLATFSVLDEGMAIFDMALAYLAVFMLLGFFAHSHPSQSRPA